jgi:16S rRNA C967 or C1407 C5-methylase (RsmB/RsmF family)/NOL1/NOP2/fmu family ribosome biogenesis protein
MAGPCNGVNPLFKTRHRRFLTESSASLLSPAAIEQPNIEQSNIEHLNFEQLNILLASLHGTPGFDAAAFVQAHAAPAPVSIRTNPAKPVNSLPHSLGATAPVPWHSHGHYLAERPSFTLDPLLHAGAYYVQEASSMFLQQAVAQCLPLQGPIRALDLCAAPGGKSTLLQALLPPEALLVSNEVIKSRAAVLTENITKWGAANVVVTNNDPAHFGRLPGFFDLLVVDAPCSGSGLFRRDAAAIDEWSPAHVALCCQRQQRILADALPALKPGGLLVYATCSYSPEEDEGILQWLMAQDGCESRRLRLEPGWGIVETQSAGAYGYRFFPHRAKGEGFFIACLTKKQTAVAGSLAAKPGKQDRPHREEAAIAAGWLQHPQSVELIKQNGELLALPPQLMAALPLLQSALYIKKAGIKLGKAMGRGLVPAHELALSGLLPPSVQTVELDRTNALQYLRRQEMAAEMPKGWCLVRYQGLALGWAKGLGNRSNNYYPKEWRVLMGG